ncbi:helix-turn-helix domain-containing protein [Mycolicibacterium fortuitum]|uniref:helix-turn-helix domain-containing protein n=1 Tax=Mycolicibacterium fortuitum TaxID=1766 RepID=UPI002622B2BD|nr:helix-turn-helix transcriptional regulator [Mycolicibacterium fortuitum]
MTGNQSLIDWLDALIAKRDTNSAAVAEAAGINKSTITKWRGGQRPSPVDLRAVANALNAPVLSAFVAAGYLTPNDTRRVVEVNLPLSERTNDELLAEVRRRIEGAGNAQEDLTKPHASDEVSEAKEMNRYDPAFDAIRRAFLADVERNGQAKIRQNFDSAGRRAYIAPEHWVRGYRTVRIDDLFDQINPFIASHTDPDQPLTTWYRWLLDLESAVEDWDRANKNIQTQIIRALPECTLDQLRLLLEYVQMGLIRDFFLEFTLEPLLAHWKRTDSPLPEDSANDLAWTLNRLRRGRQTEVGYQQANLATIRDAFDTRAAELLERLVDRNPSASDLPNAFEELRSKTVLNGLYPTDVAHYITSVSDLFTRASTHIRGIGEADPLMEIDEFLNSDELSAKAAKTAAEDERTTPHTHPAVEPASQGPGRRRTDAPKPKLDWEPYDNQIRDLLQQVQEIVPNAEFLDEFDQLRRTTVRDSVPGISAYINAVDDILRRAEQSMADQAERKAATNMIAAIEEFQRTHQLVAVGHQPTDQYGGKQDQGLHRVTNSRSDRDLPGTDARASTSETGSNITGSGDRAVAEQKAASARNSARNALKRPRARAEQSEEADR